LGGYGEAGEYSSYGVGGLGGVGGDGIRFTAGGEIVNYGAVAGGAGGVGGYGYTRSGQSARGGDGVALTAGGGLVNAGAIVGGQGAAGAGAFDHHNGAGGGAGVRLGAGGDILNTGTVSGGQGGAGSYGGRMGGAGGSGGDGIDLAGGGTLVNLGLVQGAAGGQGGASHHQGGTGPTGAAGVGVYAGPGGAATVTSAGTIAGGVDSLVFASASDVLIADAGARFVGAVVGGGGTFDLGAGNGQIGGLGGAGQVSGDVVASFSGFGAYGVAAGGHWTLSGTNALGAGQSLAEDGVLDVASSLDEAQGASIDIGASGVLRFEGGASILAGGFVNSGLLATAGASVEIDGAVGGFGKVAIQDGILSFESTFSQGVNFSGRTGQLALARSQSFLATISGFAANGQQSLDLGDIAFVSAGEAVFSGNAQGGLLTVSDGTHTAHLRLNGAYLGDAFTAASDGRGGVVITAVATAQVGLPLPAMTHAFVAAMAGLGDSGAGSPGSLAVQPWPTVHATLTAPRTHFA
jgi:hypothetical protein